MNYIDKRRFRREHPDLVRTAAFRMLIKVVIAVLWYGFIVYSCMHYGPGVVINREGSGLLFFIVMGIILYVPFGVFKIHHVVTDHDWIGTVTDVEFKEVKVFHVKGFDIVPFGIVHIRREDGRTHKIIYRGKKSKFAGFYHVYERVIHRRGFKYCERADKFGYRYSICLRCGHLILNEKRQKKCDWCSHTLA